MGAGSQWAVKILVVASTTMSSWAGHPTNVCWNAIQEVHLADQSGFRHALWQMDETVPELFKHVTSRVRFLQKRPAEAGPSWSELTSR
jgi:hypothetical protein